jgi:hypothetical protein
MSEWDQRRRYVNQMRVICRSQCRSPSTDARRNRHLAARRGPGVLAGRARARRPGRVNHVVETVTSYCTKFPTAAQARFVPLAVREIELRDLAPGAWAQRQINARLEHEQSGPWFWFTS